jgi:type VI protein secretion system component VasK
MLDLLTRQPVRLANYAFAGLLVLVGSLWTLGLAGQWARGDLASFRPGEELILALAMVVGGTKLFATNLLVALFASHTASNPRAQDRRADALSPVNVEPIH